MRLLEDSWWTVAQSRYRSRLELPSRAAPLTTETGPRSESGGYEYPRGRGIHRSPGWQPLPEDRASDAGLLPVNWSGTNESLTPVRAGGSRDFGRHTAAQIIRKFREAERLASEGAKTTKAAKQSEVLEQTLHHWSHRYGGMRADGAKRMKALEKEDLRLKRTVPDHMLDLDAMREVARGSF